MEKYSRVIYFLLAAAMITTLNVGITKYMLNNQLEVIVKELNVPIIKTLDMDQVVEGLMEDGFSTEEVLAYVDNLNKVMHHQNVLVLDRKVAINIPASFKLNPPAEEELHDYLKQNSMAISTSKGFKEHVRKSNEHVQSLLKMQ